MNISQISPSLGAGMLSPEAELSVSQGPRPGAASRDPSELARQFEGILVRQMLAESMKSFIDGPEGQQSYGYFISEALSDGITKGGGLGLRSILESQLRGQGEARQAAELRKQSLSGATGQ